MHRPARAWLGWAKEMPQMTLGTGRGLAAAGTWFLFPLQAHASALGRVWKRCAAEAVPPARLAEPQAWRASSPPTSSAGPLAQGQGFFLGFIHRFPGCPIRHGAGARTSSTLCFFPVLSISLAL